MHEPPVRVPCAVCLKMIESWYGEFAQPCQHTLTDIWLIWKAAMMDKIKTEPQRLLVAGDTHGDIVHCRYLSVTAARQQCDAVFIVGDFGYWEHMLDGVKFLDQLNAVAVEAGVPFYFCDGNHDKTSMLMERYGGQRDDEDFVIVRPMVRYAPRGHRWAWNSIRFIALGGAYSVDKQYRLALEQDAAYKRARINARRPPNDQLNEDMSGQYWFPEEEMTDEDMAKILVNKDPVDVIFCHDKPRGSNPGWNRKDLSECWPNQDRIQLAMLILRPKLLVHGHLHYRYFQDLYIGDDEWTSVAGLNCNTEDQMGTPAQPRSGKHSWMVLNLELPFSIPTE